MNDLIPSPPPPGGEFLFYGADDGRIRLQVRLEDETVWLSLSQMADLFQRDKSVISRHIGNVFGDGELKREATVAKSATVQIEGDKQVTREIEFYNLDVIISVGYRVKSLRGTQFRIWATQRLREYIVKGFAMDDERLKQRGGGNYFEELLGRIRDIRSSEKEFWRKVLEIYATSCNRPRCRRSTANRCTCATGSASSMTSCVWAGATSLSTQEKFPMSRRCARRSRSLRNST